MSERSREHDVQEGATIYDTDDRTGRQPVAGGYPRRQDIDVVTPTDRIRWGPIIAGIFAAITSLVVLTLLGLAIGLTTVDPNSQLSNYGIGAGIWGAISALLAFGIGGFLAARTAAVGGRSNGLLNGAMVWVVAIPLLLSFVGSGISALLSTAGSIAGTAAQVGAPAAGQLADDPQAQNEAQQAAEGAVEQAQEQAQQVQEQVTPQDAAQAAQTAGTAVGGTLLSLLLGLAAAAVGGAIGARDRIDRRTDAAAAT